MLRYIIAITIAALLPAPAMAGQSLPASWAAWVKLTQPVPQDKEAGIRFSVAYRDQVCPLQQDAAKKQDCKVRLGTIIDNRQKEETIVTGMLDALNALPNGEGIALVKIVNPVYQQMNDETNALMKQVLDLYPRQQASTSQ